VDFDRLVDQLERFGALLPHVVNGISPEDAKWRPQDGGWSILEVVRHMADEEAEDFRPRLESTLRDPTAPWKPIDPPAWAIERQYNDGNLDSAVERFTSRRAESIQWLRGLDSPDFARSYLHLRAPGRSIRAGDLLVAWAAHDALHLRQIAKRMYQLIGRDGGDYRPDYAGEWKA